METNTTIQQIEAATVPAQKTGNTADRHVGQKERTALIRKALKDAGIKSASVKAATGSMCYWTNIRFDGLRHGTDVDYSTHNHFECEVCTRNRAADQKINDIILANYPNFGDRSDSQTDHFDFMYSVSRR